MKALIFGKTGQVATELQRRAPDGWAFDTLGRDRADLSAPEAAARAIAATNADVVINAAAYTAVDQAETDQTAAHMINADAPSAMAEAAATRGLPFLHVSTDYVFNGETPRPWLEDDAVAPLGVYGASKLMGERGVVTAGGPHVILRTAWVFSAHGKNFVKTMLRLGAERDMLSIVDDQRGGPTPAAAIADALWTVASAFHNGKGESGIFHFAGAPSVSWAEFAEAIFDKAHLNRRPGVTRIPSAEFRTPAERPKNSVLDCTKIADTYGIAQPDWQKGLVEVIRELESTA